MAIPKIVGTIDALDEVVTAIVRNPAVPGEEKLNGGVGFQVTGTFSGTLTFEMTRDGSTYANLFVRNDSTGGEAATTTAVGVFSANLVGVANVRVKATAWTSGSAEVTIIVAEG